jgi:diketogulonate reductase-like aldo/keto reductase
VDLYLIHTPLEYTGQLKEVWADMQEVQKAGLAKSIGVSNFGVKHLEEILSMGGVIPAVNQACVANSAFAFL